MTRGHKKMARERLADNGKRVHLAREGKIWPAVARESLFLAREDFFFHLHSPPLPRSRGLIRGELLIKKNLWPTKIL